MKASAMLIGIVLIALGTDCVDVPGHHIHDPREGGGSRSLKITAQKEKTIPLPPILGGLALAGGIVLVVVAARKSTS